MKANTTNIIWQEQINKCLLEYDTVSRPRNMEVREVFAGSYRVEMPAFIDLIARRVNVPFMFSEAAWILSGSNRLSEVSRYMKGYGKFSDDQVFMRGAYGPKVIDQLGYVVDSIVNDNDTRQAVINIWRERPGLSKDIPCTLSLQFLLRNGVLNTVVTMRSQDIVLGFTYDVFTFSMISKAVQLLLADRGVQSELGTLYLTAGSLHLYERHYDDVQQEWFDASERDEKLGISVDHLMHAGSYETLIDMLEQEALLWSKL